MIQISNPIRFNRSLVNACTETYGLSFLGKTDFKFILYEAQYK